MKTKIYGIVFAALILSVTSLHAQNVKVERKYVREGNELLKNKKINEAGESYIKALVADSNSTAAHYNLGNALYLQGKFKDAQAQFDAADKITNDKTIKAKAYHNNGNSFMQEKNYQAALESYKKSLLLNPKDDETRYNLAYAQEMLKQQQKQKDKDKKDKDKKDKDKKNQDQNKDKKDQDKDKNKDQNNNHDQQKKEQNDEQKQKEKEQQQAASQQSKEDTKHMLDVLTADEDKIQKKEEAKKARPRGESEKNW